jgi:hypothetical protein
MSNVPSRASSVDAEAVEEQRRLEVRRAEVAAKTAQAAADLAAEEKLVADAQLARQEVRKKKKEEERVARLEEERKKKELAKNGPQWAVDLLDKGFAQMSKAELFDARRRLLEECSRQREALRRGEISEVSGWVEDIEKMKGDGKKRKSADDSEPGPSGHTKRVRAGPNTALPPPQNAEPHPTCDRCRDGGVLCRPGTGRACFDCQRRKLLCKYPPGTKIPNAKLQRARARGQKSTESGKFDFTKAENEKTN